MLFEAPSGESSVTDFLLSHELQDFFQTIPTDRQILFATYKMQNIILC